MNLSVAEILEGIARLKSKKDRVENLRAFKNDYTIKTILQGAFDPRIVWQIPAGEVPYKPNALQDLQGVLKAEARKLYLFVKGGNDNLSQMKRETIFIQLLENLDPRDADMLVHVKDKKLPPSMKGITAEIVREAIPGLIP